MRTREITLLLCALVVVSSCGMPRDRLAATAPPAPGPQTYAVSAPGPLRGSTSTADLLVYSGKALPARLRDRVARAADVRRSVAISVGQVALGGRTARIVAADPAVLRRFTPRDVASADDVWARVAGGEAAVAPPLRDHVEQADGYLTLGQRATSPRIHVGAYASLPPLIDLAVNPRWGTVLGMPEDNALLISLRRGADTDEVVKRLRRALDKRAAVQRLTGSARSTGPQTAYLTGGSVAAAVGSFRFVPNADGTIAVDPAWVASNIATEEVPILGRVTCHRVVLPQLRAALQEIVDRGLGSKINPGEYGGCFHPRYIASDPSRGLSLHSWGIAFDVNVPGNQRGTAGLIDRDVVAIFKKWGFAWGGDWGYTDPMHFELAALVSRR